MSIAANELRPGNYIYELVDAPENPEEKEIFIIAAVNAITKTVINTDDDITQLEYCEPIPLTPEILEACGFECKVENENILKFNYGTNPVTDDWILIIVHFKEQNIFFYRNGYHQLKYLHQLQNLFYALTGQELQVKLPATV